MKNSIFLPLWSLVKRNIKLYMRNKMAVFFSVLAPIIVLLLYVLFLGKMQVDAIVSTLQESAVEKDVVISLANIMINNWMICGVLSVSCITVAFNSSATMVYDREQGNINDVLAAPIKKWVLYVSYVISTFVITFCIVIIIMVISMIYLACTGGLIITFIDFIAILGITALSTLSAAFAVVLILSFIKTSAAQSAFGSIFITVIGFLIGAYLPVSMLPVPIQYLTCFVPGTYSAGLYRNFFLRGPMQKMLQVLPADFVQTLKTRYAIELQIFGARIPAWWMTFALTLSIVLFAVLMIIFYSNKKTNFFTMALKKRKKKAGK